MNHEKYNNSVSKTKIDIFSLKLKHTQWMKKFDEKITMN